MNFTGLLFLGFAIAVASTAFAIYYWRMSSSYLALLREGASRYDEQRRHLQKLEKQLHDTNMQLAKLKDVEKTFSRSLREANEKSLSSEKQLENKQAEFQHKINSLELQKNHLMKQVDQLTDKLMLAQQTAIHEEERARTLEQKISTQQRPRFEIEELQRELVIKESMIQSLNEKLKGNDPAKLLSLKKRAAHYERLYSSMKSLREMSDERNHNWEVALRKLSGWILTKDKKISELEVPEKIGPLVGQALESIGATLVDVTLEDAHQEISH